LVVIAFLLVLGLNIAYIWQFSMNWSDEQDTWGQFGDFLGGALNPIISLMTLIAVVYSVFHTVDAFEHELVEQRNRLLSEKQVEREARTFATNQVWISPEMSHLRSEQLGLLRMVVEVTKKSKSDRVYLGYLREIDQWQNYYRLRSIWEFLANINSLLDAGLLDETLAWRLFAPSVEEWAQLCEQIDMRENQQDTNEQNLEENSWFRERVRPLFRKLHQWLTAERLRENTG
jgi:hypothetical protein